MKLIECFSASHIDNIAASLRLRPEQMFLVGDAREMAEPAERYRQLLKNRGISTQIILCDVRDKDLGEICAVLEQVIREKDEYVIDLTGGDRLVVTAVGAMLARCSGRKIRVEKYDHGIGAVRDCLHGNRMMPYPPIGLRVNELVELHGGTLHPDSYQPPMDASYRDIQGLWDVVCEDPRGWNRAITKLNELESRADSREQVYLPLPSLRRAIPGMEEKEAIVRDLLNKLHRHNVIDDRSSRNALEYTHNSTLLRYCTQKAGNALEVKTLLEGRSVLDRGAPFFDDCQMSVSIDWDGVVHGRREGVVDTRNEIDVILMHGMTPLFISCKNGDIGEDELYKLNTVAERFGGPYARKMLIVTDLDQKNPGGDRTFVQRAWDMDIFLVTDAGELSHAQWRTMLQKAVM